MLPNGWRELALGSVCQIVTGGTPNRSVAEYWNGDIPWMSSGEINQRIVRSVDERITSLGMANSNARLLAPGTVMMALNGQGKTRGKVALLEIETTCNQSLAGYIPDAKFLLPEYLFQNLDNQYQDIRNITGDDARNGLNLGILRSLTIALPPLDEQRRIAEVLKSVDAAIGAAKHVAEQTNEVWHGMTESLIWQQMVKQPECSQQLGNALVGSDYGVNASLTVDPIGHPILRMGNIQDGRIDPTDLKWGVISSDEAEVLTLREGDILFNRTNSRDLVGKVALVREPTDFLYASYIVRLRVDRVVADPYYLFSVMHSRRTQTQLKSIATPGVSQSNINPTNLKKQIIPLPDISVQREIAQQLCSVEDVRMGVLQELDSLRLIKGDLLSVLLSGRVRVPA